MITTNILKPILPLLVLSLAACLQIPDFKQNTPLKYGSMLKLFQQTSKKWLHTHEIKFPRIGAFSVTGYEHDDLGSYWQILQEYPYKTKTYEEVVKCGDVVRLKSVIIGYSLRLDETSFGLTTELLPMVHGSETLDAAINWKIICIEKEKGENINFGDTIKLKHSVAGKYVALDPSSQYTQFNCGRGCEIMRQIELHGIDDGQLLDQIRYRIKPGMTFSEEKEVEE